jgi:hypothetical protein
MLKRMKVLKERERITTVSKKFTVDVSLGFSDDLADLPR